MKLSICIPTYNRVEPLKKSILSIVNQKVFVEKRDIEIVISDNFSQEPIELAIREFQDIFGSRIKYYKNEENIEDRNFVRCLSNATGVYRKLMNDTVLWREGSLAKLYNLVEESLAEKPILFLTNQESNGGDTYTEVETLTELIKICSYRTTWIGGFGIWAEDLMRITNPERAAKLHLIQVDLLLRTMKMKQKAKIVHGRLFDVQKMNTRKKYSISRIFGRNYVSLLSEYNNEICPEAFEEEKRRVFTEHIVRYYFDPNHDFFLYPLEIDLADFESKDYFWPTIESARVRWLSLLKTMSIQDLNRLWRYVNLENATTLDRHCDISVVKVGKYTYGRLNVFSWGHKDEGLEIGCLCSIADNVTFLLGGEHGTSSITSYPMHVKFYGAKREALSKGKILLGDDVWVGYGAIILSGVRIHQGAVIGAGAVVSQDVPPYAIVAGNPAKVIKYRFSKEIIEKLLTLNLTKIDPRLHRRIIEEKITSENINEIISELSCSSSWSQ
jgi:acetyltransferase-like isoleucine patch superfamily enzyme